MSLGQLDLSLNPVSVYHWPQSFLQILGKEDGIANTGRGK